ncbi:MAG: thioredoxin domain-containing protein [Acidobacteriaceae bacterium]
MYGKTHERSAILLTVIFIFVLTVGAFAQGNAVRSTPAERTAATPPSEETVNAFLRRMFGFDPSVKWKILSIKPTEVPGISAVTYVLATEQRTTEIFVTADGRHAIVGKMIPFGADPFADYRTKLLSSVNGFSKGPAASKVLLVEFSDLQCPHCKAAEPIVEKLQQDVPGVKLVYQQFPLAQIHDWAMKAAEYSDCAGRSSGDKGFAFNDAVFAEQEQITPENAAEKLGAAVQAQGLDSAKIAACAADPATARRVQQSLDLGMSLEVNSTPTLFVNGRPLVGFAEVPYETLKMLVEFEAKQ